jgi:SOS-response transcriptional repressor LexA
MIKNIFGIKKKYYFQPPVFPATIDSNIKDKPYESNIDLHNYLASSVKDVNVITVKGNYLEKCHIYENDILISSRYETPQDGKLVLVRHFSKKAVMKYLVENDTAILEEISSGKRYVIENSQELMVIGVIKHIINNKHNN